MSVLTADATLTDRYQNTVPSAVRKALRLKKGDKVRYTIADNGEVKLARASQSENDPIIAAFLNFLAKDMQQFPERLQAVNPGMLSKLDSLVGDIDIDLDAPLSEEDE